MPPRHTRVREHRRRNAEHVREHERVLAEDPRERHAKPSPHLALMTRRFYLNELGPYDGVNVAPGRGVGGFDVAKFDEATTRRILEDVARENGQYEDASSEYSFAWREERTPGGRARFWVRDTDAGNEGAYYLEPDEHGLYEPGLGGWVWSQEGA